MYQSGKVLPDVFNPASNRPSVGPEAREMYVGFWLNAVLLDDEITRNNGKQKSQHKAGFPVVLPGFEPGTHGFSIRCSTN